MLSFIFSSRSAPITQSVSLFIDDLIQKTITWMTMSSLTIAVYVWTHNLESKSALQIKQVFDLFMSYRKHGVRVLTDPHMKQTAPKYVENSIHLPPYRHLCNPVCWDFHILWKYSCFFPIVMWVWYRPPLWKPLSPRSTLSIETLLKRSPETLKLAVCTFYGPYTDRLPLSWSEQTEQTVQIVRLISHSVADFVYWTWVWS